MEQRSYSGRTDYRRTSFTLKYACEECGATYWRTDGHKCKAGE